MSLAVKQKSSDEGGGWWKWSVWLEGPEEETGQIEYVEYIIHPMSSNGGRRITDRQSQFLFSSISWGECTILIRVKFRGEGREDVKIEHWLRLEQSGKTGEEVAAAAKQGRLFLSRGINDLPFATTLTQALSGMDIEVLTADDAIHLPFEPMMDYLLGSDGFVRANYAAIIVSDDENPWVERELREVQRRKIPFTIIARGDPETLGEKYEGLPVYYAFRGEDNPPDMQDAVSSVAKDLFEKVKASRRYLPEFIGKALQIGPRPLPFDKQTASREKASREKLISKARDTLRGGYADTDKLKGLGKELKGIKQFGYARRIFAKALRESTPKDAPATRLFLAQQLALCTYKDPDLPAGERYDRALEILGRAEDLGTTKDQETLGLAGAIHKRKWMHDSQKQHLERSLAYYLRGHKEGITLDHGYTSINAAFVLDQLANQESAEAKQAGYTSDVASSRRKQAREIRKQIVTTLPGLLEQPENRWLEGMWWFLVTVAEAYFGLARYDEARPWLYKAAALEEIHEWEYESTAQQLAEIARLQDSDLGAGVAAEGSPAWKTLYDFLGQSAAGVRTAFVGKVGLGLSGGGFRASLFHIGVLARLAEMDVLRSVEVLSCVSGGSIVGAHYYLEVRKLLQEKEDQEITREDYIEIVKRIERDFLEGVQKNIRTRIALNPWINLRMIFSLRYSRSELLGQLYEKKLYSSVKDGEGEKDRFLSGLHIFPKGESEDFTPKNHNWKRQNKVPILILNASTLNTGHNWQFTASWMGEPPSSIDSSIDANYRLRRMYYKEAPEEYRDLRLGIAVAASACVPGLFDPIVLRELYPGLTVRLVDGGVYDNQGVAGLLDQDCNLLLVSDASGQLKAVEDPGGSMLSVPLRSSSILQSRVRRAEYEDLDARRRSSLLRGLMYIHLKKELDDDPKDWTGCEDPRDASDDARPIGLRGPLTRYGIRKDVQHRLATIRTDLDSFSDAEAFALMTSGYRMTQYEFAQCIKGFPAAHAESIGWGFLEVEPPMKRVEGYDKAHHYLMKLLAASSSTAFKIWKLSKPLRVAAWVLAVIAAVLIVYLAWTYRALPVITVGALAATAILVIVKHVIVKIAVKAIRFRETLVQVAAGLALSILGWLAALIHLSIFDRLYLNWGRIKRLGLPADKG